MLIDIPLHARDFVKVSIAGEQYAPSKECCGQETHAGPENSKKLRETHMETPNVCRSPPPASARRLPAWEWIGQLCLPEIRLEGGSEFSTFIRKPFN